MNKLEVLLKRDFIKTSLADMSDVKLLNRTDTKFIFNRSRLYDLLSLAKEHYDVLEINDAWILDYKTQYYDTIDFDMYHAHQNRKLNRYKIRQREYLISNIGFMEIKFKSNKKRTIKSRAKISGIESDLSDFSRKFIDQHSIFKATDLHKALLNGFSRMTLVHKHQKERITIDLNLDFVNDTNHVNLPYLAIVEVKREGHATSDFIQLLKRHQIYRKRFSKYSIGLLLLTPSLKSNSFKQTLLTLNKIKKYA